MHTEQRSITYSVPQSHILQIQLTAKPYKLHHSCTKSNLTLEEQHTQPDSISCKKEKGEPHQMICRAGPECSTAVHSNRSTEICDSSSNPSCLSSAATTDSTPRSSCCNFQRASHEFPYEFPERRISGLKRVRTAHCSGFGDWAYGKEMVYDLGSLGI